MIKSLFKRSGKYFLGLTTSKILSSIIFIVLARHFGPSGFGEIIFFWALSQLFTSWFDFGLIQWYQKKVHNYDDKQQLLWQMIEARLTTLLAAMITATLIFAVGKFFSTSLIILFVVILIPEAFNSVLDGFYLARHESPKVATKSVLKLILSVVGYLLLWNHLTFFIVFIIVLTSSAITLIWYFPWKHIALKPLNFSRAVSNLRSSSRYAVLIVTSYAYAQGDSIIIRVIRGSSAIGFYGAAYRYLEAMALLPTALQHNLFPISAKPGSIPGRQLKKILVIMVCIGAVTGVLLFFLSEFLIIRLFGPSYYPAVAPLRIFSLVIFLFFINSPLATIVQSSDLISKFLPFGVANTALNLALNLLLVPIYGINAAALIMLISESTGLIINLYFVRKVYRN